MNRSELLNCLEYIRTVDEDIPIQTLNVFLYISTHGPECRQIDLSNYLGMGQSSVSRNISYLSKRNRLGKVGLSLVESYEDPNDRRYKYVRLTLKGRRLCAFIDTLGDSEEDVDFNVKRTRISID